MSTRRRRERSRVATGWRWALSILVLAMGGAGSAAADWLVTTDGGRVETRGPWQVKGRMVVFTTMRGTLSSLRLDEVDVAASEAATKEAAEVATAPVVEPPTPKRRAPALVLTDADVAQGTGGPGGFDGLIAALRQAHGFQDLDAAMGLVHWSGVSEDVRGVFRDTFAFLFARPIKDITLVDAGDEDTATEERDGVTYRPNLDVTGKLVVALELIEDDADNDRAEVTFLVGEVLGVPRIVAAAGTPGR